MLKLKLLVGLLMLSSGCGIKSFDVCPSLYSYSEEFQQDAAEQLAALPPGSPIAAMVGDYGKVRNQIRVCRGEYHG